MKMKIGNVELKNNIILAPMAGVNTSSYRNICLEHGAGLVCTEMISDKGLAYENVKTLRMIEIEEKEHPISMQIFGSDYKTITASAIQMINKSPIDILDVNMGCPVNKVTKSGAGSSLLKTPEKIYDIVKSLKENVNIPVTIKIRAGWDVHTINCDKVASLASSAGVDAIAIHGRTRSQMYTGTVNLDYIKMVKDVATCPVIGNGDIKDIESAKRVFDLGVEGIKATDADILETIDEAIQKVSSQRAKLGAVQNRMEYAIESITVTGENLTSAESRIRDVDMASEMVNFTKNNILQQSAMSMLAQANQQPMQILSLLQ